MLSPYNKSMIKISKDLPEGLVDFLKTTKVNKMYRRAITMMKSHFRDLRVKELLQLKPTDILQKMQSLKKRLMEQWLQAEVKQGPFIPKMASKWRSEENKMFQWLCCCLSYSNDSDSIRLNCEHSDLLKEAFEEKEPGFIDQQIQLLNRGTNTRAWPWSAEEDKVLLEVMSEYGPASNMWSEIAYQLYKRSRGKHVRHPHVCRERWNNHLNSNISKNDWTDEEYKEMFRIAREVGTKWKVISKTLETNRSEHMVKNRIKAILKSHRLPLNAEGISQMYQILLTNVREPVTFGVGEDSIPISHKASATDDMEEEVGHVEPDLVQQILEQRLWKRPQKSEMNEQKVWLNELVDWHVGADVESIDLVELGYQQDFKKPFRAELLFQAEVLERQRLNEEQS